MTRLIHDIDQKAFLFIFKEILRAVLRFKMLDLENFLILNARYCYQEAKSNENAISLSAVEEHVHVDLQEIFHRLIDDRFDLFEICNSQAVEQLSGGVGGVGGVNGDTTLSGGQPQLNGGGESRDVSSFSSPTANYRPLIHKGLPVGCWEKSPCSNYCYFWKSL